VSADVIFHVFIPYFSIVTRSLSPEVTEAPMPIPFVLLEEIRIFAPSPTTMGPVKFFEPVVTY
jgi:hypothetical protein